MNRGIVRALFAATRTLTLAAGLLSTGAARAHALSETTAQIVLRAGHAEVVVSVDPLRLLADTDEMRRALAPLALVDPETFGLRASAALAELAVTADLRVDGAPVGLTVRALPAPTALVEAGRRVAMAQAVGDHPHPAPVEVVFDARLASRPAALSLSLPSAAGPVLITLVEPRAAFVRAGRPAVFTLSAAPAPGDEIPTRGIR